MHKNVSFKQVQGGGMYCTCWGDGVSTGSSRRVPNVVIHTQNASIDHHAHELHDIMNGRRENLDHPYYLLKQKTNYKQITYNFETSKYTEYQKKKLPQHL